MLSLAPLHVRAAVVPDTEMLVNVGLFGFCVSAAMTKLSGLVHGDQLPAASAARTCQYHVAFARPFTTSVVSVVLLTVEPVSLSLVA